MTHGRASRVGLRQQRGEFDGLGGRARSRGDELVHAIDGCAHQAIEIGAGHRVLAFGSRDALGESGDVGFEREYVGIGRHSGVATVGRSGAVRLGGLVGRQRRAAAGVRRDNAAVHLDRRKRERRPRFGERERRGVAREDRPVHLRTLSSVEDQLLEDNRCPMNADRIRVVECVDGEVPRAESSGCQQRAEDEDGLVAALPRFGHADARKPACACLVDARVALGDSRPGRANAGIVRDGLPCGLLDGQDVLGPDGNGQQHEEHAGRSRPRGESQHVQREMQLAPGR